VSFEILGCIFQATEKKQHLKQITIDNLFDNFVSLIVKIIHLQLVVNQKTLSFTLFEG